MYLPLLFNLRISINSVASDEPDFRPAIDSDLETAIEKVAGGRPLHNIELFKPENQSLGFSVVGVTRAENEGQLGIYVQGIQPGGLAAQ